MSSGEHSDKAVEVEVELEQDAGQPIYGVDFFCGSFAEKRYRVTYPQLKDLGYRNLVHAYYHYETDPE